MIQRNLLISIVLIGAFLTALGGSMVGAAQAFVNLEQYENIEDFSLEDVVPVDPFLSGIGSTKPELRKFIFTENLKAKLDLLVQLFAYFDRSSTQSLGKDLLIASSWRNPNIWLEFCNLRL